MGLLSNLKSEGLEKQEDRLGGFSLKETDLYPAKVKVAYITKSANGALGMNILFDIASQEYREPTIWFTNTKGENFYFTKDDKGNATKTKAQLPGFALINNLCRLSIDKELSELDTEEKVIKVYDPEEKKEVNKSLPVIVDLGGAEILLAIRKVLANKSEKGDKDANGKDTYHNLEDIREYNEIVNVFHLETQGTVNELEAGKEPEFAKLWQEKYKGKVHDIRTIKDGNTGAPKSSRASSSAPQAGEKKTSSLFKK